MFGPLSIPLALHLRRRAGGLACASACAVPREVEMRERKGNLASRTVFIANAAAGERGFTELGWPCVVQVVWGAGRGAEGQMGAPWPGTAVRPGGAGAVRGAVRGAAEPACI